MPYYSVRIPTRLSTQDAVRRILTLVRPRRSFVERLRHALETTTDAPRFEGVVSGEMFTVTRVIRYKNSFLPVIHGTVEQGPEGAIVRLRMRLNVATSIFMAIWFASLGLVVGSMFDLTTVWMLIAGALMTAGGFFPEAVKAAKVFRNALNEPKPR